MMSQLHRCLAWAGISSYLSGLARDPVLAACLRARWFHSAATQTEAMVLPDALSRAHQDPTYDKIACDLEMHASLSCINIFPKAFAYKSFM